MPEAVLEKHRWVMLADGMPDDAIRIVNKAIEIVDRLTYVVGMVSGKGELNSIEENLEVLRLSVSVESLVNLVIALTKIYGGKVKEVDQLVTEFKNLIEEVQEAQRSGSFASTPKGTAEYIVTIVNILERVYNILHTTKSIWIRELGAEKVPRKKIHDDVESCIRTYFDLLLTPAIELNSIIERNGPSEDPSALVEYFTTYALLIPQRYIPKGAYVQMVSRILSEKKYLPIRNIINTYLTGNYAKYAYEPVQTTEVAYVLSNAIEMARAEIGLLWSHEIVSYLDAIPVDLVFLKVTNYTKEEISLALTALKEEKNIEQFWKIFVNVALKSVGVHVEMNIEEDTKKKQKKSKQTAQKEFDVEIPPDVEAELAELFG